MRPLYRAQQLLAIEGAAQGLVDIPYGTRGVSGRMYRCRRGEAVALMQAREPQRSPHPFSFLLLQHANIDGEIVAPDPSIRT